MLVHAPRPAARPSPGPPPDALIDAMFRSDGVGLALLDRELRYVRVNELMAAINLRRPEDHVGVRLRDVAPPIADALEPLIRRVLESGRPVRDVRVPGQRTSVDASFEPVLVDGRVAYVLAICTLAPADHAGPGDAASRLVFETFLAGLSSTLIDVPLGSAHAAVDAALASLGRALDVDRVVVMQHRLDQGDSVATHRWNADDVSPASVLDRPITWSELPWLRSRVFGGLTTVIADVAELPPEAAAEREAMRASRSIASVIAPMSAAGVIHGALMIDITRPRARFGAPLAARLSLVAQLVGNALHREHLDRLAQAQQAFERHVGALAAELIAADAGRAEQRLDGAIETSRAQLGVCQVVVITGERARCGRVRVVAQAAGPRLFEPGAWIETEHQPAWLVEALRDGRPTIVRTASLPSPRRERLEAWGIAACVAIPLAIGSEVVGTLLFYVAREGEARPELIDRGRLLGHVVAHALARVSAERARQAAFEELAALKATIERERDYLREEIRGQSGVDAMIAESPAMKRVLRTLDAVAPTPAAVLVRGETGVGKELVARAVHARSDRADRPLVKVNCASIPRELFESEFFGHVKGSFTGAHRDRQGRFELADGGTIFLDEVGEIPLDMQAKLLRVLQEGELERVGDDRTRRVDVRIVAATNRDLERDVAEGRFRRDLYYRLSVFPLVVPPLRERPEDVLPLARHFLARHAARLGRRGLAIGPSEAAVLRAHAWPGNVRELAHVIERAVIVSATPPLRLQLDGSVALDTLPPPPLEPVALALPPLPSAPLPSAPLPSAVPLRTVSELREIERESILAALARSGGRVAGRGGAAELLGMRPSTLRDRIRALGIRTTRDPVP